jgi:hypothetical protein
VPSHRRNGPEEFKSLPEWVGSWGTSSGGHQVLLAAMRALNPTYSALPGPAGVDAKQACVILHDTFWLTEAAHEDASPPAMLKRGEKCELPPALVFGGDKDEWVPVEGARAPCCRPFSQGCSGGAGRARPNPRLMPGKAGVWIVQSPLLTSRFEEQAGLWRRCTTRKRS